MNAQDILQDQIQLDFRADILNALTVGGGINDRVSAELSKLSNKKSHLINQLKKIGRTELHLLFSHLQRLSKSTLPTKPSWKKKENFMISRVKLRYEKETLSLNLGTQTLALILPQRNLLTRYLLPKIPLWFTRDLRSLPRWNQILNL